MTVAELIQQLVELDKSMYTVDVRHQTADDDNTQDLDILGVATVIDDRKGGGWVTLEIEEPRSA